MSHHCEPLNPLQRDGVSQRERLLAALRPEYIKVDERGIEDWLVYAREYAGLLRYYNLDNKVDGDWRAFIEKDVSTLVAMIATSDTSILRRRFEELAQQVECAGDVDESSETFGALLGHMCIVADRLASWINDSLPGLSLHNTLLRLIDGVIGDGFGRLLQYLERAIELGMPVSKDGEPVNIERLRLTWPKLDMFNGPAPFPKGIPEDPRDINRELNRLRRLFEKFYEVTLAIVKQAPGFLEETFEKYPSHEPHMALFLAFLNLLIRARDHMNGLTKRHLDFYYKEVLQLENRPEVPDRVHAVLTLAQNFAEKQLVTGTAFDAAKDDTNVDRVYNSTEEIIVNTVQLDEDGLKTVFLDKAAPENDADGNPILDGREILNIYAAPDADTADGKGGDFEEEPGKWMTLGSSRMPFGEVGFAIASPQLLLNGGKRTIDIIFTFGNLEQILEVYGRSVIKSELRHNVSIYLSGKEGWISIGKDQRIVEIEDEVTFRIPLSIEDAEIVAYDDSVLEEGFNARYPVVRFILDNEGLSTLGNFDLNLAAGVDVFNPAKFYLPGDLVWRLQNGQRVVFRFNSEFIGELGENTSLWIEDPNLQPVEFLENDTSGNPILYPVGDIVSSDGQNYRATADIQGISPESATLLWTNLGNNTFRESRDYQEGDLVSYLARLWIAIAPSNQSEIPGSTTSSIWREAAPYDDKKDYKEKDFAIEGEVIFQARVGSAGVKPRLGLKVWSKPIRVYQSSEPYKRLEKVGYNSMIVGAPYSGHQIYILNADFVKGEAPDLRRTVWKSLTYTGSETKGQIIEYEGRFLEQTVDATSELPPAMGESSNPVWEPVEPYPTGNGFVAGVGNVWSLGDKVYTLNARSTDEPPSSDLNIWRSLMRSGNETQGQLIESGGIFYRLNANSTTIGPGTNRLILNPIPTFSGSASGLNSVYRVEDALYRLNADATTVVPPASGTTVIERLLVDSYVGGAASPDYSEGSIVEHEGELYILVVKPHDEDKTPAEDGNWQSLDVRKLGDVKKGDTLSPALEEEIYIRTSHDDVLSFYKTRARLSDFPDESNPILVWAPDNFVELIATDNRLTTDVEEGKNYRFQGVLRHAYASVDAGSDISILDEPIWDVDSSVEVILYPPLSGQPPRSVIESGEVVLFESNYFIAQAETSILPPNTSVKIWDKLSSQILNIKDNEFGEDVIEGAYYAYEGIFYLAHGLIIEDTPLSEFEPGKMPPVPVWRPLSLNSNSYSNAPVQKDDIVEYLGSFYQAQADITGLPPDISIPIWELDTEENEVIVFSRPHPPTPDFSQVVQGSYIYFEPLYYQANARPGAISPDSNVEIWESYRLIDRYSAFKEFEAGNLVRYQGNLFQAQAPIRGLLPTSTLLAWEPFSASQIEDFDPRRAYREGEYVISANVVYKAAAATFGIPPDLGATLWTEEAILVDYNEFVTYDPESNEGRVYVRFEDDSIFRPRELVTGEDPQSDPTKWKPVGFIEEYSDRRTYYTNSHVRFEEQVFKAIQIVPPGLKPTLFGDNIYWAYVPASYPYKYFQALSLEKMTLQVDVLNYSNLILENDDGVIDSAKPFRPFGSVPNIGSNLYVGSHEIFQKKLDNSLERANLKVNIDWGDLPLVSFVDLYDGYLKNNGDDLLIENNLHFEAKFDVLANGEWEEIVYDEVENDVSFHLFESNSCDSTLTTDDIGNEEGDGIGPDNGLAECPATSRVVSINGPVHSERKPDLVSFDEFDKHLGRGFIRINLLNSFYHDLYAKSISTRAIERAAEESADPPPDTFTEIPNPPYTPVIDRLRIDYFSEETINFLGKSKSDFPDRIEQFFHIHPFGQTEFYPIDEDPDDEVFTSPHLVPAFEATLFDDQGDVLTRTANGTLYIGLRNVRPPQRVHLLFQMAEGSEDPEPPVQHVAWSYLTHNRWVDFKFEEVEDGTRGLLKPGIIKFALPKNITSENTILPAGVFWIKASVADFAGGVARAIAIHPQAVEAEFVNNGNDPNHLAKPLPAKKITALVNRLAEIMKVEQPYESFGGRLKEQDDELYRRVSERLRHKNRAVTIYDYERLVLEAFPDVFKVKCINHTNYQREAVDSGKTGEHVPGVVSVIVLPNLQDPNAIDPLRPRVSTARRLEIQDFVNAHASDFATPIVESPQFEELRVSTVVTFLPGKDVGFHKRKLQQDLVDYLAPWLKNAEEDLVFGATMTTAELVNFIDERDYIDFVCELKLEHRPALDCPWRSVDEAKGTTSRSLLIPVPADQHEVIPNTEKKCPKPKIL